MSTDNDNKDSDDFADEKDNDIPLKKPKGKSASNTKTIKRTGDEEKDVDESADVDENDGRRRKRSLLVDEGEAGHDVEAGVDHEIKKTGNSLASKKSVAQGMMDIALITANANQLRYMVEYNQHSSTFYVNIILISISLILQLAMGIILIYKTWLYMQGKSKQPEAKRLNIYVTAGVFVITIINVFIASFTVTGAPPVASNKR
ncbi:unnamed protein product [Phyllotreta striolata]|uniref:Ninjurin-1 n=1 Tax=Phyllotreta striolata TaxID=444603 RepID=A0A9N9THX3_PHYSR|nr:unnamed protein product [Phyllotreta striolata]